MYSCENISCFSCNQSFLIWRHKVPLSTWNILQKSGTFLHYVNIIIFQQLKKRTSMPFRTSLPFSIYGTFLAKPFLSVRFYSTMSAKLCKLPHWYYRDCWKSVMQNDVHASLNLDTRPSFFRSRKSAWTTNLENAPAL